MNTGIEREAWFTELGRIERRMNVQVHHAADSLVRTAAGTFRSAMPAGVTDKLSRVEQVRDALEQSAPIARQLVSNQLYQLSQLSLDVIWPILISMLRDLALVYGGSVVVGAGIGGAVGSLGFGVGAIPGAAAGGSVGAEAGTWLLTVLGLASLLNYIADALPKAFIAYKEGFRLAWGPDSNTQRDENQRVFGNNFTVARGAIRFAEGHVIVFLALLAAIVAYLLRGKGEKIENTQLLNQIRNSPKLGPDVARWVERNEAQLLKEPALRPKAKPEASSGKDSVKPSENLAPRRAAPLRPSQDPPPPPKTSSPSFLKSKGTDATRELGAVPGKKVIPPKNAMPDVPDGFPEIPKNVVLTFAQTPDATTLPEGTTLYRIIGVGNYPAGSYWTRDMPTSEAEWRADSAVKGIWNGNGGYVQCTVPKGGMPAWTGTAAPQNAALDGYVLPGGGDQVWIPEDSVTPSDVMPSPWSGH